MDLLNFMFINKVPYSAIKIACNEYTKIDLQSVQKHNTNIKLAIQKLKQLFSSLLITMSKLNFNNSNIKCSQLN